MGANLCLIDKTFGFLDETKEQHMIIDLRSDTVTLPTPAMREAMYRAEVADDVYGEDPTINRLEELAVERTAKKAAPLVAPLTMGNRAAVLAPPLRGAALIG